MFIYGFNFRNLIFMTANYKNIDILTKLILTFIGIEI